MNELNDCRLHSCSPRNVFLQKSFLILIVLSVSMMASLTSFGQTKEKITLKLENVTLEQALKRIELESGYRMLYNKNLVSTVKGITIQVNDELVTSVLDMCLKGTNMAYVIKENTIIISKKGAASGETAVAAVVKGVVKDKKGDPLTGVSVVVAGTTIGTATDINGNFSLPVKDTTGTLLFTYVGFKMQRIVYHGDKEVVVVMEEEASELDAVTVIAYGTRRKKELIGAVSSLKAEDIKEIPTASFENLLQGRMAGVEVINQSGAPGGGGTLVVVRGYNTFNSKFDEPMSNSAPLYVIDGVPMYSFTSPETGTNTIAEIDPSIIESVEVLKDAASAAIYGSRGGNGVILITTKKGKRGHSNFSANFSYTSSILPKAPKHFGGMMERNYNIKALRGYRTASFFTGKYPNSIAEASDFMDGSYDYFWSKGNPIDDKEIKMLRTLQDSLNPFYNNATDWYKEAFRTGKIYNVNLQAHGGNDLIRYMVAAGYYEESGIMRNSDFNRMNINVGLNIQPHKQIKLDSRVYAAYTDRSRGKSSNLRRSNYKVEGLTVDPRSASSLTMNSGVVKDSILQALNEQIDKNNSYRFMATLGLSVEFIRGLSLKVDGGIDYNQNNRNFFRPSTMDPYKRNENYIEEGIVRNIFMQGEGLLTYNFSINEKHNFDLLLGISTDKAQEFKNNADALGTPSDYIHYIQGTTPIKYYIDEYGSGEPDPYETVHATSSLEEKTNLSYFGRIAYNYKTKYLLEFTLRRDGASVFGEDNRWATFPSVALGWNFSDETFFENLPWLSYGKIRVSWGQSGVQFDKAYLAHGLMELGAIYDGERGMTSSGVLNRNLGWEQSDQYDLGLDIDLFDYRIKFKADYYYRYTKDKLWRVGLPGSGSLYGGQTKQWRNAMEVSNQGIEFELTADIFRDTKVTWRTKLTASRNWNRFEKSYSGKDEDDFVIGKPLYSIYLYKDDGFYNSDNEIPEYYQVDGSKSYLTASYPSQRYTAGDPRVLDVNGDGKIDINDFVRVGSSVPKVYGGWVNELKWNNFDLNIFFTYSLGRDMYKTYDIRSLEAFDSGKGGQALYINTDKTTFWTETNHDAKYARLGTLNAHGGMLESNLEHVSYMKLKQLTLGYNLPKDWAKKVGMTGLRAFITGENVFILSNYSGVDPEVVSIESGQDSFDVYPLARKWTIGLTLNF